MYLMHMKEQTWRPEGKSAREPEQKQCSQEKEEIQVHRLREKGMLDVTKRKIAETRGKINFSLS